MPDFLGLVDLNQNSIIKPYITTRAKRYIADQAALGNSVRLGAVKGGPIQQGDDPVYWDQYLTDIGQPENPVLTFDEVEITYNTTTQSLHFSCYLDNRAGDHQYDNENTYRWEFWTVGVFFENGEVFAFYPQHYTADMSSNGHDSYYEHLGALYKTCIALVPVQLEFDLPLAELPEASRNAIVAGLSAGSGGGTTPTAILEVVIPTAARSYIAAETAEERSVTIGYAKVGSGIWTPDATAADLRTPIKTISDIHGANAGDDVIHVTIIDDSIDAYDANEVGLYFSNGQLFAVASSSNYVIRKVSSTAIRIYFDISIADLGQAQIAFGNVVLDNPPATTTTQGVVRLADVTALENFDRSPLAVTAQGLHTLFWRQIINGGGWLTGTYKLPGGVVALFGQATVPAGNTGLKWFLPVGLKLGQVMCFCQPCLHTNGGVSFMVTGWGRRYIRIKHNGNGVAKCYVLVIGI